MATFSCYELASQQLSDGRNDAARAVAVWIAEAAGQSGSDDGAAAYRAVLAAVAPTAYGLPLYAVSLDDKGGGVWVATADYGAGRGATGYGLGAAPSLPPPPPGVPAPPPLPAPPPAPTDSSTLGPEWSFDTGGGTQHVTQSIRTVAGVAGVPLTVTAGSGRYQRAIRPTKDGVEGVDVISRKLELSLTLRPNWVTFGWIRTAYLLTGTTNIDTFLGFPPGEVLMTGVSGSSQTPTDGTTPACTVSLKFAVSPNRVDTQINPDTGLPETQVAGNLAAFTAIGGWEYVWVNYKETTVDSRTVLIPESAWVEQVYPKRAYSALGLFS